MQITPIDPQITARHRREQRGQGQLPIKTKTSVGAFREIEGNISKAKRDKFRKGRSKNFLHIADAIDHYGLLSSDQRKYEGRFYRAIIMEMRKSEQLNHREVYDLLDYLEDRYPGPYLPEHTDWHTERVNTERILPFQTKHPLVKKAQEYLGLDEHEQTADLKLLFDDTDVRLGKDAVDPVDTPWCASYVACVLTKAGYKTPRGDDKLRARKYAKIGKKGTGKVGDLWVNEGHVMIIAKVEPNGDRWVIGGNQSDRVSLRKKTAANLESPDFLGFRTPIKKKGQPPEDSVVWQPKYGN